MLVCAMVGLSRSGYDDNTKDCRDPDYRNSSFTWDPNNGKDFYNSKLYIVNLNKTMINYLYFAYYMLYFVYGCHG
jgi:hypothetical protein